MRRAASRATAVAVLAALCAVAAHAGVATVNLTVRSGGTAEDAVIVFDPLDTTPPPGHPTAVIDQVNKRFVPRVSVIRTGTSVAFPNSDSIRHQVYSFSPPHPFNLKLYAGSPRVDQMFEKPGLVVLGCNIHDAMVGFVVVVDSPYFAKVPTSGSVAVTLPPGNYRLRVWHPKMATSWQPLRLTVTGEPLNLPVTIDLDPSRETAAPWPE